MCDAGMSSNNSDDNGNTNNDDNNSNNNDNNSNKNDNNISNKGHLELGAQHDNYHYGTKLINLF